MPENTELMRQKRHYCAVRERLGGFAEASRSIRIEELERQLAGLALDNEAQRQRIAMLETDLADAAARLLAQARALLAGRAAEVSHDDEAVARQPIEEIVAAVLKDFPGVTWEDIVSVRRERSLVKPRHACMRAVYERRRDLSLSRIGRIFRRDHTTVLAVVQEAGAESA